MSRLKEGFLKPRKPPCVSAWVSYHPPLHHGRIPLAWASSWNFWRLPPTRTCQFSIVSDRMRDLVIAGVFHVGDVYVGNIDHRIIGGRIVDGILYVLAGYLLSTTLSLSLHDYHCIKIAYWLQLHVQVYMCSIWERWRNSDLSRLWVVCLWVTIISKLFL